MPIALFALTAGAFGIGTTESVVATLTVDHGLGLPALGWVAALITLAGLAIALWSRGADRRAPLAQLQA
jgi:DHA1 family inner membrane transport protein